MSAAKITDEITGLGGEVCREATERVWDASRALRAHLSNFSLGGLRDYIALSRHQLELTEFVTERTGQQGTSEKPLFVDLMNWQTGHHERYVQREARQDVNIPPDELEMLRDMAWRARAIGAVLSRFSPQIAIRSTDDMAELSRHQCEIAEFTRTGKFRKSPKRRRRATNPTAVTPESAHRARDLGEALREYQGRITIRTVREFIALSKHQCELAGMLFDGPGSDTDPVFNLVSYGDEYPNAVGSSFSSSGPVGKRPRERGKCEEERFVMSEPEGRVENRPSTARTRGESASPGVPFCDTFGHVKVSKEDHRQLAQGTEPPAHEQRFPDNEISGSSYKLEPAKDGIHPPKPTSGATLMVNTPDGVVRFHIHRHLMPPPGEPLRFRITEREPDNYWGDDYYDDDDWLDDEFYDELDDEFP